MNAEDPEYWYCLKHKSVEPREGCRNADRLGPYATSHDAENALATVEARNEAWDNDPAWNDEDGPSDDTPGGQHAAPPAGG